MSNPLSTQRFREIVARQKAEIQAVDDIVALNGYLQTFNWAFIHPYLFGFEVEQFKKMRQQGTGSAEAVFAVFARSFFDLRTTTTLLEGMVKKQQSLAPFGLLIDQAVVLALQKDYAGAISLLIPIIEGAMRHYLVTVKGQAGVTVVGAKHVARLFRSIADDYVALQQAALSPADVAAFDDNQLKQLTQNERTYITKWLSIAEEYVGRNLYLNTHNGAVADKLNRHAIVHGFTTDVYYSLENFLRLYHLLFFLSWAFGIADKNAAPLPSVTSAVLTDKWTALEKILLLTHLTEEIKAGLYATYPEFDRAGYVQQVPLSRLSRYLHHQPATSVEQRLASVDQAVHETQHPAYSSTRLRSLAPPHGGRLAALYARLLKRLRKR